MYDKNEFIIGVRSIISYNIVVRCSVTLVVSVLGAEICYIVHESNCEEIFHEDNLIQRKIKYCFMG